MMQDSEFWVSIESIQAVGHHSERSQFEFPCEYYVTDNGTVHISYSEHRAHPDGQESVYPTTVVISTEGPAVSIQRHGEEDVELTLKKGKRSLGRYLADFGEITVGTLARGMTCTWGTRRCYVELDYVLDINRKVLSENRVIMIVKER